MSPILPPKSIRFAMFDMDGTLLDSMFYWRNALVFALEARGFRDLSESDIRPLATMTMRQGVEYLSTILPKGITVTTDDAFAIMLIHYEKDILPKAGVQAYLAALKADGVRMCITSASQRFLVEAALTKAGLAEYFEFILSPDDFPMGKRTPDMFEEALRRFGAKAEETALYEDALYSLETAKPMGFYLVGVGDDSFLAERDTIRNICDEFYEEEIGVR